MPLGLKALGRQASRQAIQPGSQKTCLELYRITSIGKEGTKRICKLKQSSGHLCPEDFLF